MSVYQCPICNHETSKDLIVFLDHTNEHIIDAIKKQNPAWVTSDGMCKRCVEFYESQFKR